MNGAGEGGRGPDAPAGAGPERVARRLLDAAAALEETWRYATDAHRVGPAVIHRLAGTAAAETFLGAVAPCVLGLREMAREVAPDVLRRVDAGEPDPPPEPAEAPNATEEGVNRIVSALEAVAVMVMPEEVAAWTGAEATEAMRWAEAYRAASAVSVANRRPTRPDFLPEPWVSL